MGGKDIVYMKQQHSSTLPSDDVQRKLKEIAEKRFSGQHIDNPSKSRDLKLVGTSLPMLFYISLFADFIKLSP